MNSDKIEYTEDDLKFLDIDELENYYDDFYEAFEHDNDAGNVNYRLKHIEALKDAIVTGLKKDIVDNFVDRINILKKEIINLKDQLELQYEKEAILSMKNFMLQQQIEELKARSLHDE